MASTPPVIAGTVIRVNSYQYKASYEDGSFAGVYGMLRDAQAAIERSISPGGAPLPWRQQDREDSIEIWWVLKDPTTGRFIST